METWKVNLNFPNYLVSDHGRIMNLHTKRILKTNYYKGKVTITLTDRTKARKSVMIAVLVYETFSEKFIGSSSVIKYKDSDPSNVRFDNIEVISRAENLRRIKGLKEGDLLLEDLFVRMQKSNGFISDLSQFSAGELTMVYDGCTERYSLDEDIWKRVE